MQILWASDLLGVDPRCEVRVRVYPELDVPIEQLSCEDLEGAQHQWAYGTRWEPTQFCFEEDCNTVRLTPFHAIPEEDQIHITQTTLKWVVEGILHFD